MRVPWNLSAPGPSWTAQLLLSLCGPVYWGPLPGDLWPGTPAEQDRLIIKLFVWMKCSLWKHKLILTFLSPVNSPSTFSSFLAICSTDFSMSFSFFSSASSSGLFCLEIIVSIWSDYLHIHQPRTSEVLQIQIQKQRTYSLPNQHEFTAAFYSKAGQTLFHVL